MKRKTLFQAILLDDWPRERFGYVMLSAISEFAAQASVAHRLGLYQRAGERNDFKIEPASREAFLKAKSLLLLGTHFTVALRESEIAIYKANDYRTQGTLAKPVKTEKIQPGHDATCRAFAWSRKARLNL